MDPRSGADDRVAGRRADGTLAVGREDVAAGVPDEQPVGEAQPGPQAMAPDAALAVVGGLGQGPGVGEELVPRPGAARPLGRWGLAPGLLEEVDVVVEQLVGVAAGQAHLLALAVPWPLPLLERAIEVPVASLPLAALSLRAAREIALVAGDASHLGVRERAHEEPKRLGNEQAVGVREHQDLARGPRDGGIQGAGLAAPGEGQHGDPVPGVPGGDLARPVARAVRGQQDLEPVPRIIQRQDVLESLTDAVSLVVSGDDQAHPRSALPGLPRPPHRAPSQQQEQWKDHERERDEPRRSPEEDLHQPCT